MVKRVRRGVSALALVAASGWFGVAQAQQADGEEAATVEEVVVVATKRPETIFEVPVAVTAYGEQQLQAAQIRSIQDLQVVAPTLSVNSSSGSTQTVFTVRGIGTAGQNTGLEQSVGVFIDGVYRGRPGSALGDYVDIEQIEVLRGPQGTLFGRNTSAGVVSVRTRAPSYEPSGVVEVSAGSLNFQQLRASITGPLIADTLAFRLSGSYQKRDGYVEDVNLNDAYNDRNRWSVRGQLLWDINPNASLRVIADFSESDEVCCVAVPVFYGPTGAAISALGGTRLPGVAGTYGPFSGTFTDPFRYQAALNPSTQQVDDGAKDQGLSAELNWDLGESTFTAIAARRKYETRPTVDADFTNLDLLTNVTGQDIDENSLELRLASNGDRTVDWLLGAYVFNQDIFADQDLYAGTQFRPYLEAITPRVPFPAPGGPLTPILRVLELATGRPIGTFGRAGLTVDDNYDYQADSWALFGQATWNVTDRFSLTGGLRYTTEEKSAAYDIRSFDALSQIPLVGPLASFSALRTLQANPAVNPFSASFDDENWSGAFSAAYEVSDSVNLYARLARGYKSGGLNLNRTAAQTVPGNPTPNIDKVKFESETVDAFELGGKFRLFERRVSVNANLFWQTLSNFQTNAFDGTSFRIINAGEAENFGVEWDYAIRLTDWLSLDGGGTWQDMEYTDFTNGPPTAAQAALGATVQNMNGKTPNFVSDWTVSGGATVRLPLGEDFRFVGNLNYLYRSEYATAQDLDPLSIQDGYVTLNGTLSLVGPGNRWSIDVWGKNLTDEGVYNIVFDTTFQNGSQSAFVNEPKTYGVTLRARF